MYQDPRQSLGAGLLFSIARLIDAPSLSTSAPQA
jgi:hypothetical protein